MPFVLTPEELDSDAGMIVRVDIETEDPFKIGFAMSIVNTQDGVVNQVGEHLVADGPNEGSPVLTQHEFLVMPEFFGGEEEKVLTVNFKTVYNTDPGSVAREIYFTEQVQLSVGDPPTIIAS